MRSLALIAIVIGCSSSSSGPDVPARCEITLEALCTINAGCSVEVGQTPSNQQQAYVDSCIATAKSVADCSLAAKITGNPDACEADLAATPCGLYAIHGTLPLPDSCKNLYN